MGTAYRARIDGNTGENAGVMCRCSQLQNIAPHRAAVISTGYPPPFCISWPYVVHKCRGRVKEWGVLALFAIRQNVKNLLGKPSRHP